ncbi:MAG: pyridoxal-phosphate dependent enzyme [Sphingomonadaceae bacterium]
MKPPPLIEDIERAQALIAPHINRTPLLRASSLDATARARLHFKCENFQKTGSFKARGALNSVLSLPDSVPAVVTHSSGNHAAALAHAAARRGIAAHVVMPHTAPAAKKAATAAYGATIVECEPTLAAREEAAARLCEELGAQLIPPFDDPRVVAGQGTATLELVADAGEPLDLILVPVGGGGLLAGTLVAAAAASPRTQVIGVEPAAADDAARGFRTGQLQPQVLPVATIADGVTTAMSPMTFEVMRWFARDMVTASEAAIVDAMRLVWERMKLVIEPSCALPLAAILEGAVDVRGKSVGIILTGGNVDLDRLPWHPPPRRD